MYNSLSQPLSLLQQRFCDEYLIDLNATQAAIRAGYTEKSAAKGGLLTNPRVQQHIRQRQYELRQTLHIDQETVLQELAAIAFADPAYFYNLDGTLKPVTDLDPNIRAAMAGIDIKNQYTQNESKGVKKVRENIHIRLHSKIAALDKLMRHLGLGQRAISQKQAWEELQEETLANWPTTKEGMMKMFPMIDPDDIDTRLYPES